MAAAAQVQALKEEVTCSICLDYFNDPVSVDCGHSFCRACIAGCQKRPQEFTCPQCRRSIRKKSPQTNWQLRNIVEKLKRGQENLCEKHQQTLLLFCEEDQTPICLVCERSEEHQTHTVGLLEEAAKWHKVFFQDLLCRLRKETERILESKLKKEEQCNTMRNKVRAEKQKIASEIEQLRQVLRDKEQTLYGRLEEMEKTITVVENANISKLSNRITSLNALITDLEKKCEESALDLLKDVRSTLNRCNEVKLQGPEQEFKEGKEANIEIVKIQKPEEMKKYKVTVTLDPDTAHPELLLFEGRRRLRWLDRRQPLQLTHKRFTCDHCVLGSEGFTSGRHYWEVQLLQKEEGAWAWAVGVVDESVDREEFEWSPEGGVWAVQGWGGQYWALTSPETRLSPREEPLKLGVYLDYEGGRLSLYNADSMELLYTFPRAPFRGRLFPFLLSLWSSRPETSVGGAATPHPGAKMRLVSELQPPSGQKQTKMYSVANSL